MNSQAQTTRYNLIGCCCPCVWADEPDVACAMACSLPEIEEGEDEDPDQIDEVPVEAHDLHGFVAALPAGEEAAPLLIKIAAPDFSGGDEKEDYAEGHMRTVEACDHEE